MAINKVEFGDQTLIDLTGDTVTEDDVLNGKSFHDKSGSLRSGTASYPVTDVRVNNTSVLDGTVAKITQGTAATKDVPASGNASTSQVVMGNDTRLTDSRNAKDVYTWAKAATKPSYTAAEVGAIATSAKGANGGVAELDSAGKVPSSQLPSFNAVTQTATSTSADYEVLFSATADNTTRTEGARKNSNLKFNPSTGNLQATKFNGAAITYTSGVSCAVGATTCTISNSAITTSSLLEAYSSNSSGATISISNITTSAGKAILTFDALTEATSFRLKVTNV